jgi:DNA transposition AAA+ family ATPase
MQQDLKLKVIEHAKKWIAANKLTQNDAAKKTGITAGYLSQMLRGILITAVDGKDVPISDKQFYHLASATGFAVNKQYWGTVMTDEFRRIIFELTIAKTEPRVTTIINETGLGKTYAVDKFCMENALHTYKITVNSMHKVKDIIHLLAQALGIGRVTSITQNFSLDTLMSVSVKLRELKMMGHQPLIIIDEAENLKLPVIQMLKGLYDAVVGYASIVIIGTSQLTDALERMSRSNRNGAPQFYRRVKAGIRVIQSDKDFTPFFKKFGVEDKEFCRLLTSMCNNYGELHDYLEPALREAGEKPLTENMFRLMYNLPKYK